MNTFKVKCPSCGQTLEADEMLEAGEIWEDMELQCPECENIFKFQEIENSPEPKLKIVEDATRKNTTFQTKRRKPPSNQAEADQQLLDAAFDGDLDTVKYLLEECHANIDFTDENGYTPLLKSCISGNNHILYKRPPKNTALSEAKQIKLVVKYLIEKGANVNARAESFTDLDGKLSTTALHLTDDSEVTELLLKHGANINALDESGNPPLIRQDNYETFKVLLKYGANINCKGENGQTALHYHCSVNGIGNSHMKIIKELLSLGAEVNISDQDGETSLHKTRDVECAKLLLSKVFLFF